MTERRFPTQDSRAWLLYHNHHGLHNLVFSQKKKKIEEEKLGFTGV